MIDKHKTKQANLKRKLRDLDRRITKLDRRTVFDYGFMSPKHLLVASRQALDQRRREVRRELKARTE